MQKLAPRDTPEIILVNSLSNDQDWLIVEVEGHLVAAFRRDHWSPELMAEAWAEYAAAS